MLSYELELRPRYAETDQMGFVYYGRYAEYFEVCRAEMIRHLGLSYSTLEREHRIFMPVRTLEVQYRAPARYDDLLRVQAEIREMPETRMVFHHHILNPEGKTVVTGRVELLFVDAERQRPIRAPKVLIDTLARHGLGA